MLSFRAESCPDALLGVEGREFELLDEGLDEDDDWVCFEADFEADLLADDDLLLDFLTELAGFFLMALAGLAGVLKLDSPPVAPVKLNSLIGDTDDLLFTLLAVDFLADFVVDLFLLAGVVVFFLMEAGVVLALLEAPAALGLGVPLMGFEVRLAGVAVCLAIL